LLSLGWTEGIELGMELRRLYNLQIDHNLDKESLLKELR
jgi:hypothetical protein